MIASRKLQDETQSEQSLFQLTIRRTCPVAGNQLQVEQALQACASAVVIIQECELEP